MSIRGIADRIGLDYDAAVEAYCGDVPALAEAIRAFPSSSGMEDLRGCIAGRRWQDARKAAHDLRKKAEKAGLGQLAHEASLLEEVSDEKMEADFMKLDSLYGRICRIIEEEKL